MIGGFGAAPGSVAESKRRKRRHKKHTRKDKPANH
jgi:hypothetical protein